MRPLLAPTSQIRARISFWRFLVLGTAVGAVAGFTRSAVIVASGGFPSTFSEFVGAGGWLLWSTAFFMFPLVLEGLIGGIVAGMMSPLFSVIRRRALATTIYTITNVLWFSGTYVALLWASTGFIPLAAHAADFMVVVLAAAIASAASAPLVLFRQR